MTLSAWTAEKFYTIEEFQRLPEFGGGELDGSDVIPGFKLKVSDLFEV